MKRMLVNSKRIAEVIVALVLILSLALPAAATYGVSAEVNGRNVSDNGRNEPDTGMLRQRLATERGPQQAEYVEGEVIVRFKQGASVAAMTSSVDKLGAEPAARYDGVGVELLKLEEGMSVEQAIAILNRDKNVEYAEPNYILRVADKAPNDPSFDSLWGLKKIYAPCAWDISTGSSDIVVTVIDTGVNYNHPDLAANMWHNPGEIPGNDVDDDGNGFIDDIYGIDTCNDDSDPIDDEGHGTHCSGIIGAAGNNSTGVVGVNWNVQIMALKFLDSEGSGYTSDAIEALEYVIDMKVNHSVNVVLTSNSWGGGGYSQALYDAIAAAGAADMLFVAAAGNDAYNNDQYPAYPASYDLDNIISVAATDKYDNLAYFSNYGPASVDLGAPGVSILSTYGNGYVYLSGTSMAAPHVSGVAALVSSVYPDYTCDQVKGAILDSVDVVPGLIGKVLTGGRLNACRALGGTPVPWPDIWVNPTSFNTVLPPDTVKGYTLTIGNFGDVPLTYNISDDDCPWLDEDPKSGNVTSASPAGIAISIDTSGLELDEYYYADIIVESNDPDENPMIIPVSVFVTDPLSIPYCTDFESGMEGWTSAGFWNLIQNPENISVLSPDINPNLATLPDAGFLPAAVSGTHAWWFGEAETGTYIGQDFTTIPQIPKIGGDSVAANRGDLISPPIDLTGVEEATLSFASWYETEGWYLEFDTKNIMASIDNGVTWEMVDRIWPIDYAQVRESEPVSYGGGNASGMWIREYCNLKPFVGNVIRLKFEFDTGDNRCNGFRGWLIDDLCVDPGPPSWPSLELDPVHLYFNLSQWESATVPLTIRNTGEVNVLYGFYDYWGIWPWFSFDRNVGLIEPGGTDTVQATVTANLKAGTYDTYMIVSYDKPRPWGEYNSSDVLRLPITVTVTGDRDIAVAPGELNVSLLQNSSGSYDLAIANNGSGNLTYTLRDVMTPLRLSLGDDQGASSIQWGAGLSESYFHTTGRKPEYAPLESYTYLESGEPMSVLLISTDNPLQVLTVCDYLTEFADVKNADGYWSIWDDTVPTLGELIDYDAVMVWSSYEFVSEDQQVALGNVLADYVDMGGGVVAADTLWTTDSWALHGRFMDDGYSPFILGGVWPQTWASLGEYNASHSIMTGVGDISAFLRISNNLALGAELVAQWNDGTPFVATRPQVAGIALLPSILYDPHDWIGDVPTLVHNALVWAAEAGAPPAECTWMEQTPNSGWIEGAGETLITLNVDTTGMEAGDYFAAVIIENNDLFNSFVLVPVHLNVLLGATPTPTVSPTPTATASPTISPTVSPTPTVTPSPTPTAAVNPGDVNGDGRINCIDITQCDLCILYPETYPKENYPGWDANEDNTGPNAGDILAVELRILELWPP